MSRVPSPSQTTRQWLSGLVVTAVTITCLYSFARLSLAMVVYVSAGTTVIGLVISWIAGRRLRSRHRL